MDASKSENVLCVGALGCRSTIVETYMKSNQENNLEAKLCGRPRIFFFHSYRAKLCQGGSEFHSIASSNCLSEDTIAGGKVVESSSLYARPENALPLILQ